MTSKTFTIASNNAGKSDEEIILHNLELRLRLQEEWVQQTKNEIEYVKGLIQETKNGL